VDSKPKSTLSEQPAEDDPQNPASDLANGIWGSNHTEETVGRDVGGANVDSGDTFVEGEVEDVLEKEQEEAINEIEPATEDEVAVGGMGGGEDVPGGGDAVVPTGILKVQQTPTIINQLTLVFGHAQRI
jgi:hypothetical protein